MLCPVLVEAKLWWILRVVYQLVLNANSHIQRKKVYAAYKPV